MAKNIKDMSNRELLSIGSEISTHNKIIQEEWFKRYEMNFPYYVDQNNNIVHSIMGETIDDDHCDKLILEQANKVRDLSLNYSTKIDVRRLRSEDIENDS